MEKLTNIEIILEECGWTYSEKEEAWRLPDFRVVRSKLHKAIKEGRGAEIREKIIYKLLTHGKASPEINATVERLKSRTKS